MRLLLLTGGSRGIGRALADRLASDRFTVVEFSRTAPCSHSVRADLADPLEFRATVVDALARLRSEKLEELIAVSNAATLEPIGPVSRKATADVVANLDVNVTSAVLFIAAVVAQFQAAPCRKVIVNMAAGAAREGAFGWSLYCAAKVAMDSFMRSLAIEQQAEAFPFIPVSIDPGVVDTNMHVVAASASPADFPASARFAARRAEGRLTSPDLAAANIATLLRSRVLVPGKTYDAREVGA